MMPRIVSGYRNACFPGYRNSAIGKGGGDSERDGRLASFGVSGELIRRRVSPWRFCGLAVLCTSLISCSAA